MLYLKIHRYKFLPKGQASVIATLNLKDGERKMSRYIYIF